MIFPIILTGLYYILLFYGFIIFVSIILSWVPNANDYKILRKIRQMGDWYLWFFRGKLILGSIDFTPMVGLFLYQYIVSLI